MLSQPVEVAPDAGTEHGVIDDVENYCNNAINDYLGPRGGWLTGTTRDDLLLELFAVVVRCSREYEPDQGISFRTYVYRTVMFRITDWYRKRGGDRRYAPRPVQESIEDRHEEIGALAATADVDLLDAIDTTRLTPESRMTLKNIVRPMLEVGITKDEIAGVMGWSRREVNRLLNNLRKELSRQELVAT